MDSRCARRLGRAVAPTAWLEKKHSEKRHPLLRRYRDIRQRQHNRGAQTTFLSVLRRETFSRIQATQFDQGPGEGTHGAAGTTVGKNRQAHLANWSSGICL